MHRGVLLEVSEAAVLLATIEDLCRRTGRQPTGRLGPLITKLRRATAESDGSATNTVRSFGNREDSAEHCAYDLVSTGEAARILGISAHGVRDLVRRGQLPAHNTGTRWLLPVRLVERRAERQAARRAG
ncbi:helix-turn-helix domain-containing protein [Mycolicibacterium smegmatis]|uniref:Helix-turn-helix domain protein n=1 Tax=Mycolicibacterium smegmatis (strain MKD8) TaxID=1214915 RepID=A0A2U9PX31_MYCSE|nr:helix-turn-helix domain-containing protein [Mycolicibacterium smegmatis]AWT55805.1 Helix-turn-helix domain protein [Mycolicibacterium smegmatis MKD8]